MPDALVLDVPVELGQGAACCSASCAPCTYGCPSVAGSSHCDTGYDKPRHPRDPVIAFQLPDDMQGPKVVLAAQGAPFPRSPSVSYWGGCAAPICCWPTWVHRGSDGHGAIDRNWLSQHRSAGRFCLHLRITQRSQERAACDGPPVDRLSSNTPFLPKTKIIKMAR